MRSDSFPGTIISVVLGITLGFLILVFEQLSQKALIVSSGLLAVVIFWMFVKKHWERIFLFGLLFVVSFNFKVHFLTFDEHVGGANGLRVSAMFVLLGLLYLPLLRDIAAGKERFRFVWWITAPLTLYFVAALLSAIGAQEPMLSFYQVIQLIQAFLLFLYLTNRIRSERDFNIVLCAISLAIAVQGTVAIAQYTKLFVLPKFLGGAEEMMFDMVADTMVARHSGLFKHPALLGEYLMLFVPLSLATFFFHRRFLIRLGAGTAAVLGFAALVISYSRASIIAMTISLGLLTVFAAVKRIFDRRTLLWGIAAQVIIYAGIALWKGKDIYLRFMKSAEGPVKVRFELADIALQMIRDHPVFGIGINNFSLTVQDYEKLTVYVPEFRHPVHNLYLLEFSETGVIGGTFFLLFLLGVFVVAVVGMRQRAPFLRYIAAAVLSSHVGYLVLSMAGWSFRLPEINTVIFTGLGLIGALYTMQDRTRWTGSERTERPGLDAS